MPPPDPSADQARAAIQAALGQIGFTLPGSITIRRARCGKPRCACAADPPSLHGPYIQWTRTVHGKTVTRLLSPAQYQAYAPWFGNARRLRALTAELQALSLQEMARAEGWATITPGTLSMSRRSTAGRLPVKKVIGVRISSCQLGSCGEKEIIPDYESGGGGSSPSGSTLRSASSMGERAAYTRDTTGPIPSPSTVAIAQSAERWAVIPEAASSNLASHPKRRWQSGNAAVCKTVASASVVRVHPGALRLLWSRRIGRCPPKAKIAGSSPAGSAARFSLVRAAACKACRQDGPIPSRVCTARSPTDRATAS